MDGWGWLRPSTDAARRRWCRVGFLVGGLLPLILVIGMLLGADGRSDWEQRVSLAVGLKARIESLETPTPRHVRLIGVELLDPERGRVLRCDEIRVSQSDRRCSIVVDRVVLDPASLDALYRHLLHAIESLAPDAADEIELVFQGVTCEDAESDGESDSALLPPSWDRMVWLRQVQPDATLWTGRLTLAGRAEAEPLTLRWERRRGDSGEVPRSRLILDTQEHSLPLAWLAPYLPAIGRLGSEVEFRGMLELERHEGWVAKQTGDESSGSESTAVAQEGFAGDCVGEFTGIDLRRWIGEPYRQVLDGQGRLTLQQARFDGGRITSLTGSLEAQQGYVGRPFIRALSAALSLDSIEGQLTGNRDAALPYRSLIVRFDLSGDRLDLAGDQQGILLASAEGFPLLAEGPRYPRRPQDLARGLVPDSRVQVPLTRETSELLDWLPLPSTASLEPITRQAPRGALRME